MLSAGHIPFSVLPLKIPHIFHQKTIYTLWGYGQNKVRKTHIAFLRN